mgnify:FL=1|tara:strand:- start:101 stop:400 length:300 start_codon:yes stop_codon:yes gene_type:complete
MNIKNITNPIRKIAKYLGTELSSVDFSKIEIVDDVIEKWEISGKSIPTADQLNAFDAEVLADIKAEEDAITKKETDKTAGKAKLKELGLTDDQIAALIN